MLHLTDNQRSWVLGLLYSRGLIGADATTSLRCALIRTPSTTFADWLTETTRYETIGDIAHVYGHDAVRVASCLRAAQQQAEPIRATT